MRNVISQISDHYAAAGSILGAQTTAIASQVAPLPETAPWWATWSLSACITLTPVVIHLVTAWKEERKRQRENDRRKADDSDKPEA